MTETERQRRIAKLKEIIENSKSIVDATDLMITNNICACKSEAKRIYIQAGGK